MRRTLGPACLLVALAATGALAQESILQTPPAPEPVATTAALKPAPATSAVPIPAPAPWTVEEQRAFLAGAEVVGVRGTSKGVTSPRRLTLNDGTRTHDASFQKVDISQARFETKNGVELNFRDYYGYNIAAHHLACLIARCDLVPAAVERKWRGDAGALVYWVDNVMMDEAERRKQEAASPDQWGWTRQVNLMRLFTELTGDSDRNQTNILITKDWRLVLIDFSRAFRTHKEPKRLEQIHSVDADVLDALRALDKEQIKAVAGRWLASHEIDAVLARRDGLLAHFDALIAQKGRAMVVYPPRQ